MAEKLIALRDISDTLKAGDRFEAPDRILVALGLAALDVPQQATHYDVIDDSPLETADVSEPIQTRRRGRGRQSS